MKAIFHIILFLTFSLVCFAQVNKLGYPFITNYSPQDYNAHNENWMSIINKNGVLFFANTSGYVIEYDGVNWNKIKTDKETIIYSLACDSNGIIYIGGVGDFGRILPDKNGKLHYESLAKKIPDSIISVQNFRKTYVGKNQEVYFCSSKYIYVLIKNNLLPIKLPKNSWFSFYIDGKLFISNEDYGLLTLNSNYKIERIKNLDKRILNRYIYLMKKINKECYLINFGNSLNCFNPLSGELKSFHEKDNVFLSYLLNAFPYHSTDMDDDILWSTIKGGLIITNRKLKTQQILTDSVGLFHNGVSSACFNKHDHTIWATTLAGISKIEINSLRYFGSLEGLKGIVYQAKRFKNILYVATDNGLYQQISSIYGTKFEKCKDLKDYTIHTLSVIKSGNKEELWIGTDQGIFSFKNRKIPIIKDITPEVILQSNNENLVYIGSQKGLWIAKKENDTWKFKQVKKVNPDECIVSIYEDNDGNCWCTTSSNGVYQYNYTNDEAKFYTTKHGLPTMSDISVFNYKNEILFSTLQGIYKFDTSKNIFTPYYNFGNKLTENKRKIIWVKKGFNNQLFFNIENRLYLLKPHYERFDIDSITFNRLPKLTIYSLFVEPNGITWIATSEGLYSYNSNYREMIKLPKCLIRQVKINSIDSVIYWGNIVQSDPIKLEYKYNNLTFSFAFPFFVQEKNNEYSYLLEGFNEQWSSWNNETKAVYTNIPEGKYIFKVKARNIYLQESNVTEFYIEILPPWHRTIWAYIIYVITGIVLFIVVIKLYTRKLEADKRRLEKIVEERTAEVVKQKNEIEEKNKEIEQKNKDITDSIYYAKRIQDSILPSTSIIADVNVELGIYFKPKDIVSGDFYFIKHIKNANILILAAADCTGHGVPGAFMSMLGISLLNEIVIKPEVNHTDIVLNELREGVIKSLNQEGKEFETKDGMDIALIAYDYKNKIVEFSGANNPLYLIRNGELFEYKADKMPIGLYDRKQDMFSRTEITVQKDDVLYIFSDGFADQFGGEKEKKYLYKRFKEFLLSIYSFPMTEQTVLLEKEILEWRGKIEQIDDHIVIGIRIC